MVCFGCFDDLVDQKERREELLCLAGKLESVLSRICLEQSEISNREIVNRFT